MWIDKQFESTEKEADRFYFLPAKAADNPHLSQSYFDSLAGLPEQMRKAFVEGNWDLFQGQYFTEWNRERHVIPAFAIPEGWKKFRAYDYGKEKPACCLWFALDYDGRVWVYREFYMSGLNADQQAQEIARLSGSEQYDYSVADPSIFSTTGMVDKAGGETIAEVFMRNGVAFIPASNRRIDGWNTMHQYLHYDSVKAPKILFFNNCYNAIRTIPTLIHDDIKVEDVDTEGEDHAADATRYFLQSLHESKTKAPLTEVEEKLQKMGVNDLVGQLAKLYSNEL
jgi:hypothetical protein